MDRTLLATERKLRDLRQRDLAAILNVSVAAVSNLENRHIRSWPKIRRDVAALFGVNESDLFDSDGRPL